MYKKIMRDIQSKRDTRGLPLEQVGITRLALPLKIQTGKSTSTSVVAKVNFFTSLPHHSKGTHMSRLVETLLAVSEKPLTKSVLHNLLTEIKSKLDADDALFDASFLYLMKKDSPVTKRAGYLDYDCKLVAKMQGNVFETRYVIKIPVMLLCPCSKAISKYNAHNQRSIVTIDVAFVDPIYPQDLVRIAEKEASCEVYPVLKRPDEKFVTEESYKNPKFVEDIVRDIAIKLQDNKKISSFVVECESIESIHNHNAYAKYLSKNLEKRAIL